MFKSLRDRPRFGGVDRRTLCMSCESGIRGPNRVEVKRIEVLGDSPLAIFAGGALKQLLSAVPGRDSRAIPITRDTVNGNFISLDMGNERYAMYMHLQPGSLRVRMGRRVIRGQVLALVGNSGNTTGPHLHFQVVDRNSPFESQGVPYAIDSFEVVGKGQNTSGETTSFRWLATRSGSTDLARASLIGNLDQTLTDG